MSDIYQRLETELEEKGEIMVKTAGGEELELHTHNVEFEEEPYIKIEADDEIHWVDANHIAHYWIHEEI
ncbi:hypothetical protein [Haladaptatus sp. DFWS20]|uniref:hypothetical protein n=1 Tax=Haladaptatus sp. DFWS20 TaxID=3403467 RepID=UPI003EC14856